MMRRIWIILFLFFEAVQISANDNSRLYQILDSLIEQYEKVKPTLVKEAVDVWLRVFCKEDLTAWLSKKKAEAGRKHPKYGKPELDIVQMMSQTFSLTDAEIDSFALDEKDFQTLITLASSTNKTSKAN